MTLSEAEEIIPLIDTRRDQENSNIKYNSLFGLRQKSSDVLHKQANTDENSFLKVKRKIVNHSSIKIGTSNPHSEDFSHGKITYSWKNFSVFVSKYKSTPVWSFWKKRADFTEQPKNILKNVYGIAHPGELLAIMGASGAGKTTLLNALTFQLGLNYTCRGIRYLNGVPLLDRDTIVQLSAYVEQENLFLGTLTVKEHLIFQSLIRMDRKVPYLEKIKRVEQIITELGLGKCQNSIIGHEGRVKGISGGEKKRLSFASEILTNPPIMLCDEPTSGLDSYMALNVINVLKSMAIRGKTVICTIHQPSSELFSLFDKILLLAEGRTAFLGKPSEAVSFFSELKASPPPNYNPADFFIQLLAVIPNQEIPCRNNIRVICDSFEQSPQGLELMENIESEIQSQTLSENLRSLRRTLNFPNADQYKFPASWSMQCKALFWRSWINILKEPLLVKVRLFQTVVLSLVVGLIYHGQKLNGNGVMNINGVIFTFLTNMTFQNLFAVISVFCSELPVFMKEQSNKLYRVDAYFLTKTLTEIPMFLAIPIIFTSITYFWINLNSGLTHFAYTILILILVTNVAISFGYFISCVSPNILMALSIGPPIVIPFLLFGGFLLNAGTIPLYFKWLSYLSWFKYGNEALLINQWSDIKSIDCNASTVMCPKTGEIVLEIYHFKTENFWWDLVSLMILILFFRFLAFLALYFKVKRHQRCI